MRASIPKRSACAATFDASIAEDGGWRVAIEMNGDERFDAVILATPANVAGTLLDGVDRELARNLSDITYSSSVTVTLGYYMEQLAKLPPGFGFLVPRSEGTRMLACTFVHNKFPHRAPEDKGILRCFLGGARDEAVLALTDEEMLDDRAARAAGDREAGCRGPSSLASIAGATRWRSTSPGTSRASRGSKSGWRRSLAWRSPAMPITASAYRTASGRAMEAANTAGASQRPNPSLQQAKSGSLVLCHTSLTKPAATRKVR